MAATEWLTYKDLAQRLGIKPESVRQKAMRGKWPKRTNNAGKVEVEIDPSAPWYADALLSADNNTPSAPPDTPRDSDTIKRLEGELVTALRQRDEAGERAATAEKAQAVAEAVASERLKTIERLEDRLDRRRSWWPWSK